MFDTLSGLRTAYGFKGDETPHRVGDGGWQRPEAGWPGNRSALRVLGWSGMLVRHTGTRRGKLTVAQGDAYATARAGGRHGAFYQLYVRRRSEEIRRGIRSLEQRIQEHRTKLQAPAQEVIGFAQLDPRQQRALIESKWPADITRLQEQKTILEGILRERGL